MSWKQFSIFVAVTMIFSFMGGALSENIFSSSTVNAQSQNMNQEIWESLLNDSVNPPNEQTRDILQGPNSLIFTDDMGIVRIAMGLTNDQPLIGVADSSGALRVGIFDGQICIWDDLGNLVVALP